MRQFKTSWIRRILITVGLFLLCNGAFTQTVKRITAAEFHSFIENTDRDNLTIIDGRTQSMFESGHLENAININAFSDEADEQLNNYLDRERLLVYCTRNNRSKTIIDKLETLGYDGEIVLVSDGITGWKSNGLAVVTDDAEDVSKPVAEESRQLLSGLKPIVQVFGTGAYDVGNKHYGYSFGRAQLGFQYSFNEAWSGKIIIDRGRPTTIEGIAVTDSVGNMLNVNYETKEGSYYTMWLKFASLKWKVSDNLSLTGGALLQNHYITQERFWGFRYIAQTFQDMYWHIPSTDLGFRADYKLNDVFSLDAALTNGEGPRMKQDAFGNVKYAAGLDINPNKMIQARIYYHNRQSGVDTAGTEQLFSVFTGIQPIDKFRIGGEFNYMQNLNSTKALDSYGFSVYSAFEIIDDAEILARYDNLNYDAREILLADVRGSGSAIMGGISYSPVGRVNLSLNYQGWIPDNTNKHWGNRVLISSAFKL